MTASADGVQAVQLVRQRLTLLFRNISRTNLGIVVAQESATVCRLALQSSW